MADQVALIRSGMTHGTAFVMRAHARALAHWDVRDRRAPAGQRDVGLAAIAIVPTS